jgi:hypothetical protein
MIDKPKIPVHEKRKPRFIETKPFPKNKSLNQAMNQVRK